MTDTGITTFMLQMLQMMDEQRRVDQERFRNQRWDGQETSPRMFQKLCYEWAPAVAHNAKLSIPECADKLTYEERRQEMRRRELLSPAIASANRAGVFASASTLEEPKPERYETVGLDPENLSLIRRSTTRMSLSRKSPNTKSPIRRSSNRRNSKSEPNASSRNNGRPNRR